MVLFGNITINGTIIYNGTKTDEMMNYVCGGLLIAYLVIGLIVGLHLIYYYKLNQPCWIDKYLCYSSISRLVYLLSSCILVVYQLLNDSPPTQILHLNWYEMVCNITSYISFYVLLAFDAVIVTIQYGNIHCPLWTLLNDSSKLKKRVLIAAAVLFTACYTVAVTLGQVYRGKESYDIPMPRVLVTTEAISNVPIIVLACLTIGIYMTTWIRFWCQTQEIRVIALVRREFRLVGIFVLSDFICASSLIVLVVNLGLMKEGNVCRSVYIWIFSGTMVPVTVSTLVACYLFISEKGIICNLFGRCCPGSLGYERVN